MSAPGLQHFTYHHVPSAARRTLFVLHGTGGDQFDMLPIVEPLQDKFQVVSLLGNVREHGMPRFFVRKSSGEFDESSIKLEAQKLQEFVTAWCDQHQISKQEIAFVGYSNGANMIAALTQLFPESVPKAVLLHGLLPLPNVSLADLSGKQFLVTYGQRDVMISPEKSQSLIQTLQDAGAQVEILTHPGGHEFRPQEQRALTEFLN